MLLVLCVVCCLLFVVCGALLDAVLSVCCMLSIVRCALRVVCCALFAAALRVESCASCMCLLVAA